MRFVFKLAICVMLAAAAGFAYLAVQSGDPTAFARDFPRRMLARLEALDSSRAGREEWARRVAGLR